MYLRASWGPMPSRVVNTMGRKARRTEPHASGKMFLVLFGGTRDEERVGGDGGGDDVGRHERARDCNVDGHGVGRAIERAHNDVDLGALRGGRTKTIGNVDVGGYELLRQVGDEAH